MIKSIIFLSFYLIFYILSLVLFSRINSPDNLKIELPVYPISSFITASSAFKHNSSLYADPLYCTISKYFISISSTIAKQ